MISEDEIRVDLEQLRAIVATHKAPGAPLATETLTIDGRELEVFSNVPKNRAGVYELGLKSADRTFLFYREERCSVAKALDMTARIAAVLRPI